jgi:cell pole-organizing protein PopZ
MSDTERSKPASGADPSMEDILASIRRILAEEEVNPAPASTPSAHDGVLQLDASMMLPDPSMDPQGAPATPQPEVTAMPEPTASDTAFSPLPGGGAEARPEAVPPSAGTLTGADAAAAAALSVGSLVRTLTAERTTQVYSGGPTIEDAVRAELRPLLKQWLDTYLPALVERLVRAEIERVVGRSVP